VPFPAGLANVVPGTVKHDDKIIVPHTIETTRLARNMGFRVPAPIMYQYDWAGTTPFKTQRITAAMLTMNRRAFVLSEMGTGKTRASCFAMDWMMREDVIRKAVIVAPLSTLTLVWGRELALYFPHISHGIVHGSRDKRRQILKQDFDCYIINHDGVKTVLPELVARQDIDLVLIDELATFRNGGTDRWKALNALVQGKPYAWGLTGSPTPNEPTDAWAQCRLLAPNSVPKSFGRFKRQTMRQVSQFTWVPQHNALDTVYEAMQPAVRFKRDDCVELPPVRYVGRLTPLSPLQDHVYKLLMKQLRVSFQQGEVTAANEGVLFSKLLQIGSGFVYTKDKGIVDLDPKPRLDELMAVIDQSVGKVIVFVDFIHAVKHVRDVLRANRYAPALVTGETNKGERDRIFGAFQNEEKPRILVAHPKCMAHGLTLTAASTIVWYTPTTSLETYEQACARITRPGQTQKSLIVHLTGTAIEAKLYKRLQKRAKLQGSLLEMFEEGDKEWRV
jgi:SNF2 family DNA or RNA helicase